MKIEYKVVDETYTALERVLNAYGAEGWEVATLRINKEYNTAVALLKRFKGKK
jgi:hypothetical protein